MGGREAKKTSRKAQGPDQCKKSRDEEQTNKCHDGTRYAASERGHYRWRQYSVVLLYSNSRAGTK